MTATDPHGPTGTTASSGVVSLAEVSGGVAFVPQATPLVRLNYYDGKFLRADDLNLEQRGQRLLVQLSNRAGGAGVVHGFSVSLASGPTLVLSGGLGIDPAGRVLYLPEAVEVPVTDLLAAAQGPSPAPVAATGTATPGFGPCEAEVVAGGPGVPLVEGVHLYVVALAHAEALCGHEDVLGRLCSQGCETAKDRPYRNEGVVVLLQPLALARPLAPATGGVTFTDTHLRSRVASAWFAQERAAGGSSLSAALLRTPVWCQGAAEATGDVVPVGVLGWRGSSAVFLDPWIVRRERMEPPSRAYWAGRTELRPWAVFLAQVLQFQCQYASLPAAPGVGAGGIDPCAPSRDLLGVSTKLVEALTNELRGLGWTGEAGAGTGDVPLNTAVLDEFQHVAAAVLTGPVAPASGSTLVDGGVVELPAAGYLPVDQQSAASLRAQLEPVFGSGVDLRICSVRRDQVPHELERAQHMDRISLLRGRADPALVEPVDILVPDGTVTEVTEVTNPYGFAVELSVGFGEGDPDDFAKPVPGLAALGAVRERARADARRVPLRGVGRLHPATGGLTAHLSAVGGGEGLRAVLRLLGTLTREPKAVLRRSRRLRVSARDVSRADIRRLATLVSNEAVAARRAPDRTTKVVSLVTGVEVEAVAVWFTCWTGGDPFSVAKGASFPFSVALDAYVPDRQSALLEFRLDGQAKVLERQASGGSVAATLRVNGVVSGDPVNLRDVKDLGRTVQFDVLVRRSQKGGRTMVRLTDVRSVREASWEATLVWVGTPIEADGVVRATRSPEEAVERRIAEGHAVQDPGVDQPGHEYHDLAVDALTILQGAKVDEPLFLDGALRALFPGGGERRSEVRPTTDWVLFRRRRAERCDDVVTAPPVSTSKVAGFVARAASKDEARSMADALRGGSGEKVAWNLLGIVEFTAGTATLVSFPSVLQQDYRDAGGASRLAFVGYGSTVPGDPTGIGRARALVDVLEPGVTLDDDNVDLVLDPPAGRLVPGTDASVFFVSYERAPAVRDCVEVIDVDEVERGEGTKLLEAILAPDEEVAEQLADGQRPLGDVEFDGGVPDDDQLAAATEELSRIARRHEEEGDRRAPFAVGWIAADLGDEQAAAKEEQLARLSEALGIPLETIARARFDHRDRCSARFFVLQRRG